MDFSEMTSLIQKAINIKNELLLKVKTLPGASVKEVRFCPYIYGLDQLEIPFIWGYLPEIKSFYKLFLTQIESVDTITIAFSPFPNARYLKPDGEEHYCILKGSWRYIS